MEKTEEKKNGGGFKKVLRFWVLGKLSVFGFGWLIGGILVLILTKDLIDVDIILIICGVVYISLCFFLELFQEIQNQQVQKERDQKLRVLDAALKSLHLLQKFARFVVQN
ncbi:MAG: hypothetical protein ACFFHV_21765 [Promethearchaeota archaeon]